ncbi:heavy metal-binding domain-containing protein [Flavobacterium sp.]
MKKTILIAFAIVSLSIVSCNKKENTETNTEQGHNHEQGEAHKVAYVCKMDCEKGKKYDEKGNCPVCKMELTEAKTENHEGHDHSEDAKDGHKH